MTVTIPMRRMHCHTGMPRHTVSTSALAYTPTPVARPRDNKNTPDITRRVRRSKRCSRYS